MSESYDVPVKIILDRVAQSWRATGGAVAELVPAVEQAIGSKFQGVPKLRDDLGDAILRFQEAARQPEVVIATTGTTSSGKSTVANVLVGAELLPKAVQEMSAGVVTITHDEKVQRLRIAATKGARWETGEWDDLKAREIQVRLRDTMHAYLDALDGDVAVNRNDVEPPACFISWPTQMGRRSSEFGIPEGARLKILDLPGLKYVDDDLNGSVVRAKARNALCLVAYNSFETDPRKQTALLRQIVDQVRALGGSPARMLFLLNRIDAFLSDSDPEASERRFRRDITGQIREQLHEKLPEYSESIQDIVAIPFSSEPALFASIAQNGPASSRDEYVGRISKFYRALIPDEIMFELPGSPARFTDAQREEFLDAAREASRLPQFEDRVARHIADNLPELILPDLVDAAWTPANEILRELDAAITAYSLNQKQQVEEAQDRLETINQRLGKALGEKLEIVEPLRSLPEEADMVEVLRDRVPDVEKQLGVKLSPLINGLDEAVSMPLNRLIGYVIDEFAGAGVEDDYIEAIGAKELRKALDTLRDGPYAKVADKGGELAGKDADRAREHLQMFAKAMSTTATNLVSRESSVQADRIQDSFEKAQIALTDALTSEASDLLADSKGFQNLRHVFNHKVSLDRLRLPAIRFESGPERWQRTTTEYRKKKTQTTERRWYTLGLWKHEVTKIKKIPVKKTKKGLRFEPLGDTLVAFAQSAGVESLEHEFRRWLRDGFDRFNNELEAALGRGIEEYRRYLVRRFEELERKADAKIASVEKHRDALEALTRQIEKGRDWRQFAR